MDTISFKRHRFPPKIIRRAVWLLCQVHSELSGCGGSFCGAGSGCFLRERTALVPQVGRADCPKPAPHATHFPNGYWHLDEMVIVIRGQRYWLWRAVDNEGEVLDFLVQSKRNAQAALKLMRKLLKKQGWPPIPEQTGHPFRKLATDSGKARQSGLLCPGITGRFASEQVAAFNRNQWPVWPGIRTSC